MLITPIVTGKAKNVKIRDLLKMLEKDGWRMARQKGSHRQFRHPEKPGLVTISGHPGDEIAPGTLNSVLKQAGLKGGEKDG